MTLPVDTASPFDIILDSSECDIQQGGKLHYSVWLGEVGGGANHGQITNAEVHLGDTATVLFGLPDGVTLSSASGAFVNTPEPSSLAEMALAGTLLVGARSRRRE